jgi:hypothetical protein
VQLTGATRPAQTTLHASDACSTLQLQMNTYAFCSTMAALSVKAPTTEVSWGRVRRVFPSGLWESNVLVSATALLGTPIRLLSCAGRSCVAPSTLDNTVYCVGRNILNNLYEQAPSSPQPVELPGLKQAPRLAQIASGTYHYKRLCLPHWRLFKQAHRPIPGGCC